MPPASVSFDSFAALAEPKRRAILQTLGHRRLTVTQIIDDLRWPQPMVSKHLAILRKVGLLRVERRSRQKVYEIEPQALKAVHDWTRQFERLWDAQLLRIKRRAEAKNRPKEQIA